MQVRVRGERVRGEWAPVASHSMSCDGGRTFAVTRSDVQSRGLSGHTLEFEGTNTGCFVGAARELNDIAENPLGERSGPPRDDCSKPRGVAA